MAKGRGTRGGTPKRASANGSDLESLLRFATAKPDEREHLLAAAESAYLHLARDLRRAASTLPAIERATVEDRATAHYFRAVVAKRLPELLRKPRPPVRPRSPEPPVVMAVPLIPAAPTNVVAVAGIGSATVSWDPVLGALGYSVTPFVGTVAKSAMTVTTTTAVFPGLTSGTTYTFKVHGVNTAGAGSDTTSNPVTPLALTGTGPVTPALPAFSADPVLLIDPLAAPALSLVEAASRTANKWRYEYLKQLAIDAASVALDFEGHITSVMQIAVSKITSAEQIVNSTLIDAFSRFSQIDNSIAQLGSAHDLSDLLGPLADAASQSLLVPELLEFLAKTSPLDFWIGLFEAMISDLAAAIFSSTSFSRTKRYIEDAFASDVDGVKAALTSAAQRIIQDLDTQVDAMAAPLRNAVGQVVAGTHKAMAQVFEAFDAPVLLNPPLTPKQPSVPDVDPFSGIGAELDAEISVITEQIKTAIRDKLSGLAAGTDSDLFVGIVVTYLVLPILAFLVISLAGGPFSAALLAAAVLLAAEELVHLLLRWLTGPLLGQLDAVRQQLAKLVAQLQQMFAAESNLILNTSPKNVLEALSNQLRVLKELAPQAYLDDTVALLREARDVVLRTARDLAGAAEQAAGHELATAFECVADAYNSNLPPAPLMPGGADPRRFAAAALVRDLGRLDQQRTFVEDGKELELTHRISLARVLGAASFQTFLARRECVLHLDETQLADRMTPGLYRILIKDVQLTGVFASPPTGAATTIPVTVTHLGPSRTRVRRGANPSAPPTDLPDALRPSQTLVALDPPGTDPAVTYEHHVLLADPILNATFAQVAEAALSSQPLQTYAIYIWALLLGYGDQIGFHYRDILLRTLPEAIAREVDRILVAAAGFLDHDRVRTVVHHALLQMDWGFIAGTFVFGPIPVSTGTINQQVPDANRDAAAATAASTVTSTVLAALGAEFIAAVADYRKRIARWGRAHFEEDPDPQLRSLGYARLVRDGEREAAVFNLLPAVPLGAVLAQPLAGTASPPANELATRQYRPFENRGIEGDLLIRLEATTDGVAQLAGPVLTQLSSSLTDLVLEITVRACHDTALASAVRASAEEQARMLAIGGTIVSPAVPIVMPGTATGLGGAPSTTRTLRLSLRAHRDRTLQMWAVAAQLAPASVPQLVTALASATPLGALAAYTPLEPVTGATTFTFAFDDSTPPATTNQAALRTLATYLPVTRSALGLADLAGVPAHLVSIGVAVIPMENGVRAEGAGVSAPEPLGLALQIDPLLQPLVPAAAGALASRLVATTAPPTTPVTLSSLFAQQSPVPSIAITVPPSVFAATSKLYDIIVSLSFTVPAIETATPISAIR